MKIFARIRSRKKNAGPKPCFLHKIRISFVNEMMKVSFSLLLRWIPLAYLYWTNKCSDRSMHVYLPASLGNNDRQTDQTNMMVHWKSLIGRYLFSSNISRLTSTWCSTTTRTTTSRAGKSSRMPRTWRFYLTRYIGYVTLAQYKPLPFAFNCSMIYVHYIQIWLSSRTFVFCVLENGFTF